MVNMSSDVAASDAVGGRKNQFHAVAAINGMHAPGTQPPRADVTNTGIRKISGALASCEPLGPGQNSSTSTDPPVRASPNRIATNGGVILLARILDFISPSRLTTDR